MGLEVTPRARTVVIAAAASQSTIQSSSSSVIMGLGAAGVRCLLCPYGMYKNR
jgi:hypothetical protein